MRGQDAAVGHRARLLLRLEHHAPAPSPNSTQVVRSFQSRMREKVSAPITSARLASAGAQEPVGGRRARRRSRSRPPARRRPRRGACRARPGWSTAVAGKVLSGVEVAQHDQIDVAAASRPASASAARAAADRRGRRSSRRRRRCGARGCRCAGRSTRRWCRPSWRVRHWSGRAPADSSRQPRTTERIMLTMLLRPTGASADQRALRVQTERLRRSWPADRCGPCRSRGRPRAAKPFGVGAAMALDDDAVQAEEDAAIDLARIHLVAQASGRRRARTDSRSAPDGRASWRRADSRAIWRAVPSAVFSAILPAKPSVTTTSTVPLPMSSPSTKP